MARSLRPSARIGTAGKTTLKDTKKMARGVMREAQLAARVIQREALKGVDQREKLIDKKVAVINKLLPQGFSPAPNLEILPPQIRRKAEMSAQEVLADINVNDNFLPTPLMRATVYDYAKWGVPLNDIRQRIVNPMTGRPVELAQLKKYFWEEINSGLADGNVRISKDAFEMATTRPAEYDENGKQIRPERDPNPSVLIAMAKHRLKWFETKNVIVNDNRVEPELAEALKQLTPDELRTLRSFASRRADAKAAGGSEGD